nr:hypothetical protein [Tanacetum cinerariifolium]
MKVEILGLPTIPSDMKEEYDSDDGDLDVYEPRVCYDENDRIYAEAVIFVNKRFVRLIDVTVEQWLDLTYGNHKKVDVKVKEEVEILGLPTIPSDMKEEYDSDDGDLDVYEPRVCYDENDRIYAEAVIFVNKRFVRLIDVTVEQWLDLTYGNHKKKQWVTRGIDAHMEYDPNDVEFVEWLVLKFYNHKTMDRYTKNALWIYWTRGDDEVDLTDEEFSDPNNENLIDKDEVAEIFRIETNIYDFETPICKAFNEFSYLLKIDTD